jgi:hypothetical protein
MVLLERDSPPGERSVSGEEILTGLVVFQARSRMIVTKRACTYNDPKIPFRSALIAFNVTIHTRASSVCVFLFSRGGS